MTTHPTHELTHPQLASLRAALAKKRQELTRTIGGLATEPNGAEPGDSVDSATDEIGFDERTVLAGQERSLLVDVEHALSKLDAGTYGKSEVSGRPIRYARLQAVPWARTDTGE
jgi:DnaK suppressor protein